MNFVKAQRLKSELQGFIGLMGNYTIMKIDRITSNPEIFSGKPIIRGLRISVEQILTALSSGISSSDLLEDYPELEPEDLQAVFAFAAEFTSETNHLLDSAANAAHLARSIEQYRTGEIMENDLLDESPPNEFGV